MKKRIVALLLSFLMISGNTLPALAAEEPLITAASESSVEASVEASFEASTEGSDEGSSSATAENSSEAASEAATEPSSENDESTESATGASSEDASDSSDEASSEDSSSEASSEASSESSSVENYDDYPTGYYDFGCQVEYDSVLDGAGTDGLFRAGGEELESKYITPKLPDLKDQSPYGTCWAFASTAVAEINLAQHDSYTDLSELHLAYFANHFVDDPLGGFGNCEQPVIPSNFLGRGGSYELAFPAYARWNGAASEQIADYDDDSAYASKHGLDDSIAYDNVAYLKNYYVEPVPTARTDEALIPIKNMIKKYGSAAISFTVHSGTSATTGTSEYSEKNNSFYHKEIPSSGAGHAVVLVGWDDSFPASNFNDPAPGDGAFLVRNSWTTGSFENNQSYAGYFWMSYYETTLRGSIYTGEFELGKPYDNNYQYEQLSNISGGGYEYDKAACFFTAHADGYPQEGETVPRNGETIKAVSFVTTSSNLDLEIAVYKGLSDDETDPENGTLATEEKISFTTTYAGYYTVPLANAISVANGENFSVVITNKGSNAFRIMYESTLNFGTDNYKPETSGKCYYYRNVYSHWSQCLNDIAIRVFTDNEYSTSVAPSDITFDGVEEDGIEIAVTEKKKVAATVAPANASNKNLRWSSSDENVATVDDNGLITGKAIGTATIIATAVLPDAEGNYASGSFTVNVVNRLRALKISYSVPRIPMVAGDRISVNFVCSPKNYTPVNDPVFTVTPEGGLVPAEYGGYRITRPGNMTVEVNIDGTTARRTDFVFPGTSWFSYDIDDDNTITISWDNLEGIEKYRIFTDDSKFDQTITPDDSDNYSVTVDCYKDEAFTSKTIKVRTHADNTYSTIYLNVSHEPRPCTVTFDSQGGSLVADRNADYNDILAEPDPPSRYRYEFTGWYMDSACTAGNLYDFAKKVKANFAVYNSKFTLYAGWEKLPDDIPIKGILIDAGDGQEVSNIETGGSLQLTVSYVPEDTNQKAIRWESSNEQVATVDANGLVTGVSEGVAFISAVSEADYSVRMSHKVIVAAGSSDVAAEELRILDTLKEPHLLGSSSDHPTTSLYGKEYADDPANIPLHGFDDLYGENSTGLQLAVGKSCSLKADFLPKDRIQSGKKTVYTDKVKNRAVTWTSGNTAIATVTSAGKVTGKSAGTTVVTLASSEGGLVASCRVTVFDPVTTLTIDKKTLKMGIGQTAEINVVSVLPVSSSSTVRFSSSKPEVADVLDPTAGVIKAFKAGTTVITAEGEGSKKAKCTVTVGKAVTKIELSGKGNKDLVAIGKTLQMVTVFNDGVKTEQPANKSVIYGIMEGGEVVDGNEVAVITQKGVLKGLKEGVVTVRATSTTDCPAGETEPVYAEKVIYVYSGLKSATLNQKNLTMVPGSTYTLSVNLKSLSGDGYVTGSFDEVSGKYRALTDEGEITWNVNPEGSLQLQNNGDGTCLVTAPAEALAKAVTVSATITAFGAARATVLSSKVTVKDSFITGLSFKPSSVTVNRGETASLSANLAPLAPAEGGLKWEIDSTYAGDICFVDENGAEIGASTTTSGPDSNTVTIAARSNGLTVKKKAAVKVTTLGNGKNGAPLSKTVNVNIGNEADLMYIWLGYSTACEFTTEYNPRALCEGKTLSFKAVAYSKGGGSTLYNAGNQKFEWKSDDPSIAAVSATGKVTGVSNGVTKITARSLAKEGLEKSVYIGVYADAGKLTLDKKKLAMSTAVSENSTAASSFGHYSVIEPTVANEDMYDNFYYGVYGPKVRWTATGTGSVLLAAVDAEEYKAAGSIYKKQEMLALVPFVAPSKFAGTGKGELLAVKAAGAGTVKLTASAGSKQAACSVTIYSHVTGFDIASTSRFVIDDDNTIRLSLAPKGKATIMTFPEIDGQPYVNDKSTPEMKAKTATYNALKKMAVNTTVYFKSSNEAVAAVSAKGVITAKSPGTAVITMTTGEGNIKKEIHLTVE